MTDLAITLVMFAAMLAWAYRSRPSQDWDDSHDRQVRGMTGPGEVRR